MAEDTQLKEEIAAVFAQFCACWNEGRMTAIADLWDPHEAEPYFLPAEVEGPLIGWDALRRHLRHAEARLQAASMRVFNLNVKRIAPDIAVALYEYHWNGAIKGLKWPVGVDTRANAIFRRRPEGWRFISYIEAPLAFSIQLNRFMAGQAEPEFLARIGHDAEIGQRYFPDGSPMPTPK